MDLARGKNTPKNSFTRTLRRSTLGVFMTDSNLNFWGELVVPVGLLICFGPALLIWFLKELKAPKEDERK